METDLLNMTIDDTSAGFRLHRVEVYNWGTFDRHIWAMEPNGQNSLLTGDIGSGKSTLVDAITTLLVPSQRITYNKAAGAASKERSLYSYIRGEYKTEKDQLTHSAKAIGLRDKNTYTVLLAYFFNEGYQQAVTLAQVLWLKDQNRRPERFYIISQDKLSIQADFCDFGQDILNLKKRLRRQDKNEIFDSFQQYSQRFRQLFGIKNEQALDLFYQTVSMKSVGNLTQFVREHMLEVGDSAQRVEELCHNFDNLNRAHESILKARAQIESLQQLDKDAVLYQKEESDIKQLQTCREALQAYFALYHRDLLNKKLTQLNSDIHKLNSQINHFSSREEALKDRNVQLQIDIERQGGSRIAELDREVELQQKLRGEQHSLRETYNTLISKLDLKKVRNEQNFYQRRDEIQDMLAQTNLTLQQNQNQQVDIKVQIQTLQAEQKTLTNEIQSLRLRKSNIPSAALAVREQILKTLNLDETDLPFVGELLQVRPEESKWEGTIERVLHNFGLSLLVPETHYNAVSRYVDQTHLKGRLVYYRVHDETKPLTQTPPQDSLTQKLQIKPDNNFYDWLQQEIHQRFDYICCENLTAFHRLPKAITINGQIKSSQKRHEKDDRFSLNDKSRFVLGWSNREKIKTLQHQLQRVEAEGKKLADQLLLQISQHEKLTMQRDACRDASNITAYQQIDWQATAGLIEELKQEKQALEQSSDILKSLQKQLEQAKAQLREIDQEKRAAINNLGQLEQQKLDNTASLEDIDAMLTDFDTQIHEATLSNISRYYHQLFGELEPTLQNINKIRSQLRSDIQAKMDATEKRCKRLYEKLIRQMQDYKHTYPAETKEVDASIDAVAEYQTMLKALERESLPKFEQKFKTFLNEGTINGVALFQNQLDKALHDIEQKINSINNSLRGIEYDPGTYIVIVTSQAQDPDIRDFQQKLKACLSHTLAEGDLYSEQKFLQVKSLIERFRGREGCSELDLRWTQKVTDARNWLAFSASERWIEDDQEKQFHTDSSGKSGGQKEKLAYTILASALAYQFGLEWGETRSRSFRFVVIDEAFGKGSDQSTRYALNLFKKLNLQLLIVTPLQKIHVIEDYIKTLHFVHNQDGNQSQLKMLTVEAFKAEKETH